MSAAATSAAPPAPEDRSRPGLAPIPIGVAALLGAGLGTYWVYDQAFGIGDAKLVFGLFVLPGMIWAVALCCAAGFLLRLHKRPKSLALAFFLSPAVLAGTGIAVALLVSPGRLVALADGIGAGHVTEGVLAEASELPRDGGEPALKLWDLHYRGLAIAPRVATLVYDESDEIALPDRQRSDRFRRRLAEARRRAGDGVYPMEAETGPAVRWITTITPLHAHFYYVEQRYGGKRADDRG